MFHVCYTCSQFLSDTSCFGNRTLPKEHKPPQSPIHIHTCTYSLSNSAYSTWLYTFYADNISKDVQQIIFLFALCVCLCVLISGANFAISLLLLIIARSLSTRRFPLCGYTERRRDALGERTFRSECRSATVVWRKRQWWLKQRGGQTSRAIVYKYSWKAHTPSSPACVCTQYTPTKNATCYNVGWVMSTCRMWVKMG